MATWAHEADIAQTYVEHMRHVRAITCGRLWHFMLDPMLLMIHALTDKPDRFYCALRIPTSSPELADFPVTSRRAHVTIAYDAIMDFKDPDQTCGPACVAFMEHILEACFGCR